MRKIAKKKKSADLRSLVVLSIVMESSPDTQFFHLGLAGCFQHLELPSIMSVKADNHPFLASSTTARVEVSENKNKFVYTTGLLAYVGQGH